MPDLLGEISGGQKRDLAKNNPPPPFGANWDESTVPLSCHTYCLFIYLYIYICFNSILLIIICNQVENSLNFIKL